MTSATFLPLSKTSQDLFLAYYSSVQEEQNTIRMERRSKFERIDKEYQREQDREQENLRAKEANRAGDSSRFQNITIPVIMPQVESAVTYQTSVFLTGQPIFGTVASPEYEDEAQQLEAILDENSSRGGWARQLMLFFREGFKYNFAPLEVTWSREVTTTISTDVTTALKEGALKETIWAGNVLRRLDPYNTFVDPSAAPTEVYKDGAYAGYTELMSRIKLKKFISELPDKIISSIKPALESGIHDSTSYTASPFFVPEINPDVPVEALLKGQTDWFKWAGLDVGDRKINYKGSYEVTTLYARILPSEFSLKIPSSNTPQIFKLVIVNHSHIIYAERQTNAHNWIPIFIGQPLEDGLRYQTKSLADNGSTFQSVASTYMNSIIASRRRAITDRVLFDPSKISSAHINSANPSAKIPVRPSAYGSRLADSVYAFPYREDQQSASMQQISTLLGLSNSLSGQNQASQGQFVKGNKTLHEFESVMRNANGRDQLASILLEHQVFMPIKHILKLNILQFQGGTSIFNRNKEKLIEIDPVKLRKAVVEFKISDGLIPASKLLNSDSFRVALQVLGSSPQIAEGYNISQLFSYFMKTQGAKISAFEKSPEQLAYEQASNKWNQLAQLALEKGVDPKQLPEQPKPEDFGYVPKNNKPAPAGTNPKQQPPLFPGAK